MATIKGATTYDLYAYCTDFIVAVGKENTVLNAEEVAFVEAVGEQQTDDDTGRDRLIELAEKVNEEGSANYGFYTWKQWDRHYD